MSAPPHEGANDEQSGKDRVTFPTGVSVQSGPDAGHESVMCGPDDLPAQLSVALTDGGSDTIEQAAVSLSIATAPGADMVLTRRTIGVSNHD